MELTIPPDSHISDRPQSTAATPNPDYRSVVPEPWSEMHIVLATEFLPATDAVEVTGGVEAYCHYVGTELSASHQVEYIAQRTSGSSIDTATIGSLVARIVFALRATVTATRSHADVFIGTNFVTHPAVWIAGRIRRRPVVYWYPDVLIGQWRSGAFGRTGGLFELVERCILKLRPDLFITISDTVAAKLIHHGASPEQVVVIPCGYDPAEVIRTRALAAARHRRLVTVGRLVSYKRVDLVIEALALLPERHRQVTLLVIGKGGDRDRLEQLAADLGVEPRVEFTGHVQRHSDVLKLVAESSVFVSASEIEGFGIVVAEAMGLGVPYAVSDIDVFTEVTGGGKGGRQFRAGDAPDLARALTEILDDDALAAELGAEGEQWSERYQWPAIATATEVALTQLLATRPTPPIARTR